MESKTIVARMPRSIEDCIKLRGNGDCMACAYQPKKLGTWTRCNKRISLKYPDGVPASR
jgi:hypothetical protein